MNLSDPLLWSVYDADYGRIEVALREVVATERHKTRPEYGIIRTKVTVTNQDGEAVMTLATLGQVPARPA